MLREFGCNCRPLASWKGDQPSRRRLPKRILLARGINLVPLWPFLADCPHYGRNFPRARYRLVKAKSMTTCAWFFVNHGYFRIGWNLNAAGDVTGGWSEIRAIPGWFGWDNQGGGAAVTDIDGNGRKDLIIYHIDNPGGENHGYYRIGWNLSV